MVLFNTTSADIKTKSADVSYIEKYHNFERNEGPATVFLKWTDFRSLSYEYVICVKCLFVSFVCMFWFFSDGDSDTSEEGMENFLEHHRRACSVQRERESVARESVARESIQRDVRASIARESVARQLNPLSEEPELRL